MKYTGKRLNEYLIAQQFFVDDKETLNEIVAELNKKEKAVRKRLETVARKKKEAEEEARFLAEMQAMFEKLARQQAREEARKKKEAEKKLKEKKRLAIPFGDLDKYVTKFIGNEDLPFRLKLESSIANVSRTLNFTSLQHFLNWMNAIEQQNIKSESENYTLISDIIGNEDVFNFVVPSFLEVDGGCNYHGKERITKETAYYTFDLYNPKAQHNDCGFKILEYMTKTKLNYADLRKQHGLTYGSAISADVLNKIYVTLTNSDSIIVFIDEHFNDEINKKYKYIYVADNHYYYVVSATYKSFTDKNTKRGMLYWDIETRPTDEYVMVGSRKSFILKDTILCAYYCPYKSNEYKQVTFITDANKSSCRQFLDWLSQECSEGRFYHCIAHNGSRFDLYFLLSYLTKHEQLHTETQLRGYSIIGMQYKSHLFKDSCCFLTASLDSLCKAFKVKQAKLTEFQYNGETLTNKNICFYKPNLTFNQFMMLQTTEPNFWSLYVEYCMFDCIGLMHVWSSFRSQITDLINIIFKYKPELKQKVDLMGTNTIGSLSKKILENSCLEKVNGKYIKTKAYRRYLDFVSNDKQIDVEKIQFINKFKRGGISHSNQPGKHTHSLISFDIASQYPASMIYMLIPCGKSEWVDTYNIMNHGYYHLKNLQFETPYEFKPIASKNDKDVLVWNNNSIDEIYLDSFMIKYMKEHYGLKSFEVVKGLVSHSYIKGDEIFGDYINTLYDEKKQQDKYKVDNDDRYNPALRECIKLFLNSLSGKLVEDPSRYFKLQYTNDSKLKLNGVNAEKVSDGEKLNAWVSAGVMVYSYSKRLLFEYVRCLPSNSDDVIHIETDSIYFNKKHEQQFIKNITEYTQPKIGHYPVSIGADLGNVKVEKDTDSVSYFLGKKFYCIGDLYKIKGIPLKTIDEYGNDVELVNTQLYDDIYNGKTLVKEFYTMKKALFADNTYISSHKMSRTIRPNMKYSLYE